MRTAVLSTAAAAALTFAFVSVVAFALISPKVSEA